MNIFETYRHATPASADLFRDAAALFPGGVSHNLRRYLPHPVLNKGLSRWLRRAFAAGTLSEAELPADPLDLFSVWLSAAMDTGAADATAMALAVVLMVLTATAVLLIERLRGAGPQPF